MGCPKKLYKLISEGEKDTVFRYMDRHKMTPKYFVDYNQRLNEDENEDWTDPYYPAAEAAKHGHLDIMNTLIERGFDKELSLYVIHDDWGPIQLACMEGHLDVVKCLIEDHKVDLNYIDNYNQTPLNYAIDDNHTDIVKYLVASGATVDNPMLHECVRCCGTEMVELILSKGVDVNARDVWHTPFMMRTPLFNTVTCEFPCSSASVLINAGADVDARDKGGTTVFLRAAETQNVELMKLLVSRGADPHAVDKIGNTALHFALSLKHVKGSYDSETFYCVVEYLVVELGMEKLNTRNSHGTTPVSNALKTFKNAGDQNMLEFLVKYGCNITDEFDMLNDIEKEIIFDRIPNCKTFFQHLKQLASPPRSLQDLALVKVRRQLGVSRLESAVKELPLPEILKDLIRI